jgi:hypothetical protein
MYLGDAIGEAIYAEAGCDPSWPPDTGSVHIACELFGGDVMIVQPRAFADVSIATVCGEPRIVVREGIDPRRANFLIARCVVRLWLAATAWGAIDGDADEVERYAAAWLVAPPNAVQQCGPCIYGVADAMAITLTCATMRVSESGGPDSVIATPARIYRRGVFLSGFGDESVRDLASKRAVKSVRRVVLEEPGRVALFRLAS